MHIPRQRGFAAPAKCTGLDTAALSWIVRAGPRLATEALKSAESFSPGIRRQVRQGAEGEDGGATEGKSAGRDGRGPPPLAGRRPMSLVMQEPRGFERPRPPASGTRGTRPCGGSTLEASNVLQEAAVGSSPEPPERRTARPTPRLRPCEPGRGPR